MTRWHRGSIVSTMHLERQRQVELVCSRCPRYACQFGSLNLAQLTFEIVHNPLTMLPVITSAGVAYRLRVAKKYKNLDDEIVSPQLADLTYDGLVLVDKDGYKVTSPEWDWLSESVGG